MRKPEQELAEIKAMMERSSRFLSLSGLSGVLAGIYALIGAGLAYYWIYFPSSPWGEGVESLKSSVIFQRLLIVAFVVLVLAIGTAGLLSQKRSSKAANQFWSPASKRFMKALFIPVISGGLFAFSLMHEGQFELIAAATLVFYGLGLINASHFTLNEIKNLGFGQLILGLIAAFFPAYGLLCWALGFGVLHVIYGAIMYYKYER
ncbi:hypothetical protein [Belliella aquatica]|uniref:Uncharacterized protein n=1 Tax=Belliella aquatica TaxID=1323734 RepID=A0ABQ1MLV9_9BACT|nr:hypothetical protein [Belliella aquatica]MCH7405296.1 hypothetical protein [Belliella aquatica]GGC42811.1 hypothetical protein GCM10010993_21710 [Belliella aquatica]